MNMGRGRGKLPGQPRARRGRVIPTLKRQAANTAALTPLLPLRPGGQEHVPRSTEEDPLRVARGSHKAILWAIVT